MGYSNSTKDLEGPQYYEIPPVSIRLLNNIVKYSHSLTFSLRHLDTGLIFLQFIKVTPCAKVSSCIIDPFPIKKPLKNPISSYF